MKTKVSLLLFIFALMLFSGISYATEEDLLVYYTFDNVDEITVYDSSPQGNDAEIFGAVSFTEGVVGNAAYFEGIDGYLELPDGFFEEEENVTISMWINIKEFRNYARILQFAGPGQGEFFLCTWTGEILRAYDKGGAFHGPIEAPLQTWFHLAITFEGRKWTYYVNGEPAYEHNAIISLSDMGPTNVNWVGESLGKDPYLFALVDEFRVYTRALTPEEVKALYKAVKVK